MELEALGGAIWRDPVAADALAVCYEAMHRANANIEILVNRLEAEGYDFHPNVYSPYWRRSRETATRLEVSDQEMKFMVKELQQPLRTWPKSMEAAQEHLVTDRKHRLASTRRTASEIQTTTWELSGPNAAQVRPFSLARESNFQRR